METASVDSVDSVSVTPSPTPQTVQTQVQFKQKSKFPSSALAPAQSILDGREIKIIPLWQVGRQHILG